MLEIAAPPSALVIIYLLTINIKLCRWVSHIMTQVGIDVWIRVVKLLLIVVVIVIVMKHLWRNSNSNRLCKIQE